MRPAVRRAVGGSVLAELAGGASCVLLLRAEKENSPQSIYIYETLTRDLNIKRAQKMACVKELMRDRVYP